MKWFLLFACSLLLISCTGKPLDQESLSAVLDTDDVQTLLADISEPYARELHAKRDGREVSLDFMYQRAGKKPDKALGISFERGKKRTKAFVEKFVEGGITQHLPQVKILDVQKVPELGEHAYATLSNFGFGVLASVSFQKDDVGVLIELMPYKQHDRTPQHRDQLVRLAKLVYHRI